MFLNVPRTALAGLLVCCGFFTAALAQADARQCVLHNNDGAQLRDDRHLLAAREAYRACITEHECPAIVRSECDAALADIKAAMPTLLVAVVDSQGHDLADAALKVDGRPVVLDGSSIEVDPGAHELVASSGSLSSRLQLMAIESDRSRHVELVLRSPPQKPTSNRPVLPVVRSNWPAYALGGVAALGAVSFGYFGINGTAGSRDLQSCKPYCDASAVTRVRNEYQVADISLGVSLVALVSAGYWLWSAPKHAPAELSASSLSWGFTALPHAAGLSVRWVE